MSDLQFWVLIAALYFASGAVFALAYAVAYREDKQINLGLLTCFWLVIAIVHVLIQIVFGIGGGIGRVSSRMGRPGGKPESRTRAKHTYRVDSGELREDEGPGTG